MKIVFMGTPGFAAASLERLYDDGHEIAAVFTQPDKARDRGLKTSRSPVKRLADAYGTTVYQPTTLKDEQIVELLRGMRCELIAVVAYGKLLPREILSMPPLGCINIHGSLLPKYRGAAPVQWAVLNGESETGVTSMVMDAAFDSGDILLSKKTLIGENETAEELYDRLSMIGAELLSETVDALAMGKVERIPQNSADATYAPPLDKTMSPIDWSATAASIKCKVRGLTPWPIATTVLSGTVCKVFSVDVLDTPDATAGKKPGDIVSADKNGIAVACADGAVLIKELQAPGGKRMSSSDYLRGHPLC